MTDEKVETIAFVVRGPKKRLHSWIATLPLDLKIVETHHYDEGGIILSMDEVDSLRAGNYSAVHMCTRKRMNKRRRKNTAPTELEAGLSAPSVPTEPSSASDSEARP